MGNPDLLIQIISTIVYMNYNIFIKGIDYHSRIDAIQKALKIWYQYKVNLVDDKNLENSIKVEIRNAEILEIKIIQINMKF